MCVYLYSPGRKLQIDYAAESVSLVNGASNSLFDLLVTNHSAEAIDRIHIVYPHSRRSTGLMDRSRGTNLEDITGTWLQRSSDYNRFYQEDELRRKRFPERTLVAIKIPDPANIAKDLSYEGYVSGPQYLTSFEDEEGGRLEEHEAKILSALGWSVFTLRFDNPIEPNQPRWLRLSGRSGVILRNRRLLVDHWIRKMLGMLTHYFEIAGPNDLRHRIISALRAAGATQQSTLAMEFSMQRLDSLERKLLSSGIEKPGTETVINDWRLNVFKRKYRRIDEPNASGDIKRLGPGYNPIRSRSGEVQMCYQWKAGDQNIKPRDNDGHFVVRLTAYDIPGLVIILPWVSLFLSLSALLSRPDIVQGILRVLHLVRTLIP